MSDNIVLITGVSSGVGACLSKIYIENDYKVVGLDIVAPENQYEKSEFIFIETDLVNSSSVAQAIKYLNENEILPSIVILSAALHCQDNEAFVDCNIFNKSMDLNVSGNMALISGLMPLSDPGTVFMFLSSGVIYFPNLEYISYYTSKLVMTKIFDHFSIRYNKCGFIFKSVILGPLRSEMLKRSKGPKGFVSYLRDLTTGEVPELAEKIFAFSKNKRKRLYYRKLSMMVLWTARVVQFILPKKYKFYQVK